MQGLEKVKVRAQNRARVADKQQQRHCHVILFRMHYRKYHNAEKKLYYNRPHRYRSHLLKPAVNIIREEGINHKRRKIHEIKHFMLGKFRNDGAKQRHDRKADKGKKHLDYGY